MHLLILIIFEKTAMKPYFRLFALVFFFCTLLSCDKSNYKDVSYDPISIDGFYTHKVMPDGSFIIVSNEEQLKDILAEEVGYYLGKVDFSNNSPLPLQGYLLTVLHCLQ